MGVGVGAEVPGALDPSRCRRSRRLPQALRRQRRSDVRPSPIITTSRADRQTKASSRPFHLSGCGAPFVPSELTVDPCQNMIGPPMRNRKTVTELSRVRILSSADSGGAAPLRRSPRPRVRTAGNSGQAGFTLRIGGQVLMSEVVFQLTCSLGARSRQHAAVVRFSVLHHAVHT